MPSVLFWVFFACLVFAYSMGIATVYLHMWLSQRWVLRHTREQEEDHEDEGYTLTLLPRDHIE